LRTAHHAALSAVRREFVSGGGKQAFVAQEIKSLAGKSKTTAQMQC
jgi:hypothetical protein